MLRRLVLGLVFLTATLFVPATPARAGGWAAVTLDSLPVEVRAGESLQLGFTVRQHAVRPVDDAQPVLLARNRETGESVQADARKEGLAGHFVVKVTFPSAGTWEWGIDPKPWGRVAHFEPLKVLPATAETNAPPAAAWWPVILALIVALGLVLVTQRGLMSARASAGVSVLAVMLFLVFWQASLAIESSGSAPPLADAAYGRALFVAKGCHACHYGKVSSVVHGPVTGPDLADYRADPEFLWRWLRDPKSVRPDTQMPNLDLSEAEVAALIRFLDGGQRIDPNSASVVLVTPSPVVSNDSDVLLNDPSDTCPVTRPPDVPFTPPPPYPAEAPGDDEFWYGTEALWTAVPEDGKWRQLLYGEKLFWWREGYDWQAEPIPELTVTGRRLDAPAPPFAASRATNAFHPSFDSAMLVGVQVPTLGCWEITGHYGGHELSFVVWVAP